MFDPNSLGDLDALKQRTKAFTRDFQSFMFARLRECATEHDKEIELTVLLLHVQGMEEHLSKIVVNEENEQFLRDVRNGACMALEELTK
jgi:hypothetical protein